MAPQIGPSLVLSTVITCRLQRRSVFAYVQELITATERYDSFPALVV